MDAYLIDGCGFLEKERERVIDKKLNHSVLSN